MIQISPQSNTNINFENIFFGAKDPKNPKNDNRLLFKVNSQAEFDKNSFFSKFLAWISYKRLKNLLWWYQNYTVSVSENTTSKDFSDQLKLNQAEQKQCFITPWKNYLRIHFRNMKPC